MKSEWYKHHISSTRWVKLRRSVLAAHPLCARCLAQGYVTSAEEVHHITPVDTGTDNASRAVLMWSRANLQPLCRACHKAVHAEVKSHGREANAERVKQQVTAAQSRLFDPPGGIF